MSRCFPFPPPGYESRRRGGEERLIESIKLQKEKERAKKEKRKEKKREKKDEGSREDPLISEHKKEHHKKRKHDERSHLNQKGGYCTKAGEDLIEQLENSGLAEESGPPSFTQNPYDSGSSHGSTHDYCKRQKIAPNLISHQKHGITLRIRLPLVKHRDAEPPKTKESEPPKTIESEPPASNDQPCFSGRVETQPEQEAAVTSAHSDSIPESSRRIRKAERKFGDLVVDWNHPAMEFERSVTEDLDWLLEGRERKGYPSAERCKVWAKGIGHGSRVGSLQPRVCHLPDVDMYVLPYVVPY